MPNDAELIYFQHASSGQSREQYAKNIGKLTGHDHYSVCRDVWAEDLIAVEEHESVYQLVSVIE